MIGAKENKNREGRDSDSRRVSHMMMMTSRLCLPKGILTYRLHCAQNRSSSNEKIEVLINYFCVVPFSYHEETLG